MNIENLLKYQQVDEKLYEVEQKVDNNPYQKKSNELKSIAAKAKSKSIELEKSAEKLIADIEDLKAKCNLNQSKLNEMLAMKTEEMSLEDIEKTTNLKTKIASNLNILEKMLQKSAETINQILSEYNKTKKLYDEAKNQFVICEQKIDEAKKEFEPEKDKLKKELAELEKDVDKDIMVEYKKKRNDKVKLPIVVPLVNGSFCRCGLELPRVAVAKIKEKGVITCEHCKRFIYQK